MARPSGTSTSMTSSVAIGIDLGGTNLKVAAVDHDGRIHAQRTCPVDSVGGPDVVIAEMVAAVDVVLTAASLGRSDLVGVGLGHPDR